MVYERKEVKTRMTMSRRNVLRLLLLAALMSLMFHSAVSGAAATYYYSFGTNDSFAYCLERQYADINVGGFYGQGPMPDFKTPDARAWVGDPLAMSAQKVIFHEQLTRIGDNACTGMTKLRFVTIYPAMQYISKSAFKNCPLLKTILFQGNAAEWKAILGRSGIDMNTDFPGITVQFPDGTTYPYKLDGRCAASLSAYTYTFNGSKICPDVTVTDLTLKKKLTLNTDYTVAYTSNRNAGTASVTITGKGDYTGKITKSFTIKRLEKTIQLSTARTKIQAGVSVRISSAGGNEGYYQLKVASANYPEYVKVAGRFVKGIRPCTFKITAVAKDAKNISIKSNTLTFKVVPAAPAKLTLTLNNGYTQLNWTKVSGANGYYIYRDGKKIKTVGYATSKYLDKSGTKNGHYYKYEVIAYSKTYGYLKSGTVAKTYYLKRVKLKRVSVKKNVGITVQWSPNTKSQGYEIQISRDNFKNNTITRKANGRYSKACTIKVNWKKGVKVKARVRAIYRKDGKDYYSSWSPAKTITWK